MAAQNARQEARVRRADRQAPDVLVLPHPVFEVHTFSAGVMELIADFVPARRGSRSTGSSGGEPGRPRRLKSRDGETRADPIALVNYFDLKNAEVGPG